MTVLVKENSMDHKQSFYRWRKMWWIIHILKNLLDDWFYQIIPYGLSKIEIIHFSIQNNVISVEWSHCYDRQNDIRILVWLYKRYFVGYPEGDSKLIYTQNSLTKVHKLSSILKSIPMFLTLTIKTELVATGTTWNFLLKFVFRDHKNSKRVLLGAYNRSAATGSGFNHHFLYSTQIPLGFKRLKSSK